jgi:hypothetical protein
MISVQQLPHSDLVAALGQSADQALLARTLAAFDVRGGRDRLFVLGLVPPCAISPITYVWAVFYKTPRRGQLREFRRFINGLEGLDWQVFLAEVCDDQAAKFAQFMGFHYIGDVGDRQLYERRF